MLRSQTRRCEFFSRGYCAHECPSCERRMQRSAEIRAAQQTRDLGRMMRETPRAR